MKKAIFAFVRNAYLSCCVWIFVAAEVFKYKRAGGDRENKLLKQKKKPKKKKKGGKKTLCFALGERKKETQLLATSGSVHSYTKNELLLTQIERKIFLSRQIKQKSCFILILFRIGGSSGRFNCSIK